MNYFSEQFFPLAGSDEKNLIHTSNIPTYYGIQYNHAGKVRLRIGEGPEYIAEGPHVFVTHPNSFFDYGPVDGKYRHHTFICSCGKRIESYIDKGLMVTDRVPPLIPVAHPETFLRTMLEIIALVNTSSPIVPPRAVLLYESLLLQIHESLSESRKMPVFQETFLKNVASAIRENPEKERNFNNDAKKCGVTLTHFRRLFKQSLGLPPGKFLQESRLQKAAGLLLSTQEPVGRVAEMTGFSSAFYFSRQFHEKYQLSPSEYRREFSGRLVRAVPPEASISE